MRSPIVSILFAISCVLLVTAAEAAPVANLPLTCSSADAIGQPQDNCSGDWAYQLPNTDQLIVLKGPSSAPVWSRASSLTNSDTVNVCTLPVEPGTYSNCRDAAGVRRYAFVPKSQVFPDSSISGARILDLSRTPVEIREPGVYVINRNWVTGTPGGAILISADDVTVDLQGFELHGGNGDAIVSNGRNALIRNGRVRANLSGIISNGPFAVLENLHVHATGGGAVWLLGAGSLLRNSTVIGTEDSGPVIAAEDTVVRENRISGGQFGPALSGLSRTLIVNNEILACGIRSACVVFEGDNNIFSRNKIVNDRSSVNNGVEIEGNLNDAQDNVVIHCGAGASGARTNVAMIVSGYGNTVRGNLMPRCFDAVGWNTGIAFNPDGNFYGDNIVWATLPFAVGATVQFDLGGNVGVTN